MTTQLIPVFTGEIAGQLVQLCNARDLHAFLKVADKLVAPQLTVVTLPLPLLVAVFAWVDALGAWMRPKGARGL